MCRKRLKEIESCGKKDERILQLKELLKKETEITNISDIRTEQNRII